MEREAVEGLPVGLLRSGLDLGLFGLGFWSEPELSAFGLFGFFGPTPQSFKMSHIEAKSINIWLRYDLKHNITPWN